MLEKVAKIANIIKPLSTGSASLEERFHRGDMEALATIMNTYQTGIYRLGLRLFCDRDKASDFCQDVFIRAYEKCSLYNPALPIRPWLFQTAVNLARDQLRRKREVYLDEETIDDAPSDEEQHSENLIVSDELKERIWQVVNQLNPTSREVIALRFSSDLSMQEIADALGIRLSAAKVRLCRAIKAFDEAFRSQGGEKYVV